MTFLAVEALQSHAGANEWEWLPLRRIARLRRTRNVGSTAKLLALSSEEGVKPRPDDGGRQLPSEGTIEEYWLVYPDDLVFNPMWAIGRGVAVSRISGAVSTAYRVYELGPKLYPRFVHYFMRSDPVVEQYGLVVRGLTTFDRSVTREDLEGMPIPVPPVPVQRRVADYLDRETTRIDALIEKKRRMVELLLEYRLRNVEDVIGGHTSEQRRIKFLCRIERGRFTHRPRNDPALYGGDAPFVQTGDIRGADKYLIEASQTLNSLGQNTSRSFSSGTILMAIAANVGDVAIATFDVWCPDSIVGFTPGFNLDPEFVYYALLAARNRINETSTENTQENTNIELLGNLAIPFPPLETQRALARVLAASDGYVSELIRKLESQTKLLNEHREAIITAAVAGARRTPPLAA